MLTIFKQYCSVCLCSVWGYRQCVPLSERQTRGAETQVCSGEARVISSSEPEQEEVCLMCQDSICAKQLFSLPALVCKMNGIHLYFHCAAQHEG